MFSFTYHINIFDFYSYSTVSGLGRDGECVDHLFAQDLAGQNYQGVCFPQRHYAGGTMRLVVLFVCVVMFFSFLLFVGISPRSFFKSLIVVHIRILTHFSRSEPSWYVFFLFFSLFFSCPAALIRSRSTFCCSSTGWRKAESCH